MTIKGVNTDKCLERHLTQSECPISISWKYECLFLLLESMLQKSRNYVCLFHLRVPSTWPSTWHLADTEDQPEGKHKWNSKLWIQWFSPANRVGSSEVEGRHGKGAECWGGVAIAHDPKDVGGRDSHHPKRRLIGHFSLIQLRLYTLHLSALLLSSWVLPVPLDRLTISLLLSFPQSALFRRFKTFIFFENFRYHATFPQKYSQF